MRRCLKVESGHFEDESVCVDCGGVVFVVVVVEFDIGQTDIVRLRWK
jgi:hypothetical protein